MKQRARKKTFHYDGVADGNKGDGFSSFDDMEMWRIVIAVVDTDLYFSSFAFGNGWHCMMFRIPSLQGIVSVKFLRFLSTTALQRLVKLVVVLCHVLPSRAGV